VALDTAQIVQLLLRERLRICAFVQLTVRDYHATEDLFQTVVATALEQPDHFRDEAHARSWAMQVARHRAIDWMRTRRANYLHPDVLERLADECGEAGTEELADRISALNLCVDTLPDHTKRLLHLRYGEGLRCTEIASQLRRNVDAVYQALSRVHGLLRSCVEHRLSPGVPR
jgi:RNA polymerase sigma-70 factor, ECF subfamily